MVKPELELGHCFGFHKYPRVRSKLRAGWQKNPLSAYQKGSEKPRLVMKVFASIINSVQNFCSALTATELAPSAIFCGV
jgi:hypothetical protein